MILRDLHSIDEFRQVVALERAIWGYTDDSDVVSVPVFIITVKRGGILIGAFAENDRMVGFVYSLVGIKDGQPIQWSHMTGVLAEHRGSGLGTQLKLAQRQRALDAGFDLIEWTFDPLQAVNAHLNFVRLGAVAEEYAENIYGDSSSELHRGTPTDRLIVQWRIREPHVERRIKGSRVPGVQGSEVRGSEVQGSETKVPVVNQTRSIGSWRENYNVDLTVDRRRVWVEIPTGFTEMQQQAPQLALEWRLDTRKIFQTYFARGYRAVDFELRRDEGRGRYLLVHPGGHVIARPPSTCR